MLFAAFANLYLAVVQVAPFYFSWRNVATALFVWTLTHAIGICYSYHRQLTHRSFKTPKWMEYLAAWLGSQVSCSSCWEGWPVATRGCSQQQLHKAQ